MKHKGIIIPIVIISLLISTISAFAANEYEYNDVEIYVGGVYKTTTSLRSSNGNLSGGSSYFYVYIGNTGIISLQMQGGEAIATNANITDSGYSYIRTTYATQGNNVLEIEAIDISRPVVAFSTVNLYSNIKLYLNSPQEVLATPQVTVSGNTIHWSPINGATGYNIRYSNDGIYETIASNYQNTSFVCTQSANYVVQAYDSTGTYVRSDWSDSVRVVISFDPEDPGQNDDLLSYLTSIFAQIKTFLQTATQTVTSFFGTVGALINGITQCFPHEIGGYIYAIFICVTAVAIIKHFL